MSDLLTSQEITEAQQEYLDSIKECFEYKHEVAKNYQEGLLKKEQELITYFQTHPELCVGDYSDQDQAIYEISGVDIGSDTELPHLWTPSLETLTNYIKGR